MPRVKQFDRDAILEKAMQLFWERGFHATSIQNLVDHLGINRASLYDTFGNKDKLFQEAFQLYTHQNKQRLLDFLEKHASPREAFRGLFLQSIERARHGANYKGCFVVKSTTELLPEDLDMPHLLEENKREFEAIFAAYLKKALASGEVPSAFDPAVMAAFLYTFYSGLEVMAVAQPWSAGFEEIIDLALAPLPAQ